MIKGFSMDPFSVDRTGLKRKHQQLFAEWQVVIFHQENDEFKLLLIVHIV